MSFLVRKRKDRPDSGYWVIISYKGYRQRIHIGPNKADAIKAAKEAEERFKAEYKSRLAAAPRSPLLREYFQDWLETHVALNCKPSTLEFYGHAAKWINRCLGHKQLTAITRQDVRDFLTQMTKAGLKRPSIRNHLAPLSTCLQRAVDDGLIAKNPAHRAIGRQRGEESAPTAKILTREQLSHVLATAKQHFPADYPMLLLYARTGLRLGEGIALSWGQVDFNNHCLWINRNYDRGRIVTTKSGKGRRVDMSEQLEDVLRPLRTGAGDEALVFPSQALTPINPSNLRRRVWTPVLKKAGIDHMRLHDLRHTFASLLIQQGANLAYVKEQLGHYSVRVTVDVYGHLIPGGMREEVNRLDDSRV